MDTGAFSVPFGKNVVSKEGENVLPSAGTRNPKMQNVNTVIIGAMAVISKPLP